MKNALSSLISSLPEHDFHKLYEKNVPYLTHHTPDQLKPLRDLALLGSLETLISSWPSVIEAHLPDVRDEASAIETTPKDALKLFSNGMGLLFKEAHTLSPVLQEWLESLRSDLGLCALTISRCMIYATPDGKGTAGHFDQNINFVLQIHGTKKWWMAPNHHVKNPMSRHTMGQPIDPELESYGTDSFPLAMPEDAQVFELKPGSLLFVPRGYWHSTEAEGDALSLNFTFTAPTWIDIFTAALRSRLAQSPEWRETATNKEDAQKRFDFLLEELKTDLPSWRGQDILNVMDF